jgi:hypothetical protein
MMEYLEREVCRTLRIFFFLMVADECMVWLKDPFHFSRSLQMTGVSLGSYISKPFSPFTTSSHDIVIKMLSAMSKPFSSITTSSQDIVMEMLSAICQSLSPPLQLIVTVLWWKCVSYRSKPFSSITTSSHDIFMKMLSIICHDLSPHYN